MVTGQWRLHFANHCSIICYHFMLFMNINEFHSLLNSSNILNQNMELASINCRFYLLCYIYPCCLVQRSFPVKVKSLKIGYLNVEFLLCNRRFWYCGLAGGLVLLFFFFLLKNKSSMTNALMTRAVLSCEF